MLAIFGNKLFQVAAVVVAITGLIFAWRSYTGSLVKQGYDRGVAEVRAEVANRDNKQLERALEKVLEAQATAAQLAKRTNYVHYSEANPLTSNLAHCRNETWDTQRFCCSQPRCRATPLNHAR